MSCLAWECDVQPVLFCQLESAVTATNLFGTRTEGAKDQLGLEHAVEHCAQSQLSGSLGLWLTYTS